MTNQCKFSLIHDPQGCSPTRTRASYLLWSFDYLFYLIIVCIPVYIRRVSQPQPVTEFICYWKILLQTIVITMEVVEASRRSHLLIALNERPIISPKSYSFRSYIKIFFFIFTPCEHVLLMRHNLILVEV